MNYSASSIDDWQKIAEHVVKRLKSGTILALSGPLGAGKTTFVQALARVLGASSNPKSPTFSLVRGYYLSSAVSRISRLLHVDAYRLEKEEDLLPLNLDEELQEDGTMMVVEWPENMYAWLRRQKKVLWMKIEVMQDGKRCISFH